jgi:two-component system sensor histidine kinase YesM
MINLLALKNLKLKTKFLFLYLLTILLPLFIVSQTVIYISGNKIVDQATLITQENAKQLNRNITNLLRNYIDMSNRMCYYDNALKSYLSTSRKYNDVIENIDAYDAYLKMISYYGINGSNASAFLKVYFLNTTLIQDMNTFVFADEEVRKLPPYETAAEAKGALAWGYLRDSGRIYASRLFKDELLQPIGVVSIEIPEDKIYSLLQESNFREKQVIVCDNNGQVLSSNDRSLVGCSISGKEYFVQAIGKDGGIFDNREDGNYKVISESLNNGNQLPDWRIILRIPVDSLLTDANNVRNSVFLICILSLVASCILYILSLDRITNRLERVVRRMKNVKEGIFATIEDTGPNDEIGIMAGNFNSMVKSLERLIHENYEVNLQVKDMTIKKHEAELYALQSQINPHFLFNTLESVRMKLCSGGCSEEAAAMIFSLSKMLRMSLNWQGEIIPLEKELEFARYYLEINKGRYKDKMDYTLSIPQELLACKILKLTIQPIVENSIKHGLEKKSRFGTVSINAREEEGKLVIDIEDNGAGMDKDTLERLREEISSANEIKGGGSIGIKNVNDRLKLHYGKEYGLSIQSVENGGTVVTLRMPVLR